MVVKLPRRKFLQMATGAAALPAVSGIASAQTYPVRQVHVIVGLAPGSSPDIIARLIAQWLSERFGQQFVVENRTGAGATIATGLVVRAPPDGYTLLLVAANNAITVSFYKNLDYDFVRDIAPVAGICASPNVMVVNPSFPAKTIPEFITYAKSNPGKINMASPGIGTEVHVAGELFKTMAAIDMTHVPYRGGGPALSALVAGQVQVMFPSTAAALGYVRSGTLRALGVTSATPLNELPGVPTIAEFLPGYQAITWFGIGAPKNTPAAIVDSLNKQINEAFADPQIKARLAGLGLKPLPLPPAEFGKFVAEETEKWAKVVRLAKIKAE
jgi:tripartite-type tricarboxylate transporter receptor subunit TctC